MSGGGGVMCGDWWVSGGDVCGEIEMIGLSNCSGVGNLAILWRERFRGGDVGICRGADILFIPYSRCLPSVVKCFKSDRLFGIRVSIKVSASQGHDINN
jgi:hypothetical protein